jgi:hypothetical protein
MRGNGFANSYVQRLKEIATKTVKCGKILIIIKTLAGEYVRR